jgi:hypothetical protein
MAFSKLRKKYTATAFQVSTLARELYLKVRYIMRFELAIYGPTETGEFYEVEWILSQKVSACPVNLVFSNESS